MQINLIPDNSVSSAPSGFTAAVVAAAAIYDQDFPGNYTVNITYGWGTYDNQVNSELTNTQFSLGGSNNLTDVSYATVKSWLAANATTSTAMAAVASLPASNTAFPGDANFFLVSSAQEKALGVFSGNTNTIDGSIGFGTQSFNWEGLALTEIGHALGWLTDSYTSGPTISDLFRFASPGQYQWTGGQPAYFSVDGGRTDLANFSTTFDYTLFTNVAASDPFNVGGVSTPTETLTSFDIAMFNAIGFGGSGVPAATVTGPMPPELPQNPGNVLWRSSNGQLAEWLMSGSTISSSSPLTLNGNAVSPDSSWSVTGIGDFNGDGHADILWRQSTTGSLAAWLMNGSSITSSAPPTFQGQVVSPNSSWSIAGLGDFNGDGDADILWRQSSSGALATWLMNGSAITSSAAPMFHGAAVSPDSSWSIDGVGDFNGDGSSDILWRQNTSGALAEWQMNGSTISSSANVTYQGSSAAPDSSWNIVGVGDFNSGGDSDILWRQSATGSLAMWLMNGSTIQSSAAITSQGSAVTPDSTWNVVELGDFNGSNETGVLWQQSTTGSLVEWQMNGALIVASQTVTSGGSGVAPPSSWQVQPRPA